jgi:gluconate 2-dehydrogenase gamma chain
MESHDPSRRSLLHALSAVIAAAASPLGWAEIAQAMEHAHASGQVGTSGKTSFLTASEAADIDAVAARIVPTDDTPGAREAGVVYFIDRALATFLSHLPVTIAHNSWIFVRHIASGIQTPTHSHRSPRTSRSTI